MDDNSTIKEAVKLFSQKKYELALSKIRETEIDDSVEIYFTYDVINDGLEDLIKSIEKTEDSPMALHILGKVSLIDLNMIDTEDNKKAIKQLNVDLVDKSVHQELIEFKKAYYHMIDGKEYFLKTKSGVAVYGDAKEICLSLMKEYNISYARNEIEKI